MFVVRLRKTWAVLAAMFGLFWLPKNVQDTGQAAEPWRKALAMVSQNAALWVVAVCFGAWIIWTDIRPLIRQRWPSFPPRHAAILQELANELAKVEQIATRRMNALASVTPEFRLEAYKELFTERLKVEGLLNQIAYDGATAQTIRDYLQLCSIIFDDELSHRDTREDRADLDRLRGPVFRALHAGKSVDRKALPLTDWMRAGEPKASQSVRSMLRSGA